MEQAANAGGWGGAITVIWILIALVAVGALIFAITRIRKPSSADEARDPDDVPSRATPGEDRATATTDPGQAGTPGMAGTDPPAGARDADPAAGTPPERQAAAARPASKSPPSDFPSGETESGRPARAPEGDSGDFPADEKKS